LALDVKEEDEVIIPSFVCSAVLNAVNYTGATPVIVESGKTTTVDLSLTGGFLGGGGS